MAETFGRYQLLKRIAGGGMGEVFLARQGGIQGFEKLMVLKTLLPDLTEDESFITMFLDEARIAAGMAHPNVVHIFDLGEVEGIYYIAMEYIHGEDQRRVWREAYKQNIVFPVALSARIISEAAAGLGYAHRLKDAQGNPIGLVHRDVSPQNILITFDGGVKVIDFGVAKAAGRITKTSGGALKGKYSYMSPEQVTGEDIDHRSDIFSLGTMFWEILTGSRLFKADSDVKTMRAVADCVVVPPSVHKPTIPPALDPIVLKALARDRTQRYQTMDEFRLDIENWLTESHSSGSAAHLGQFMQKLFAERLEKEGDKGPLYDVDPNATGFSPLQRRAATRSKEDSNSSSSSSSLQSLMGISDLPTGDIRKAAAKKGPQPWMIAAGVGGAVLVIGGGLFLNRAPEQVKPVVQTQPPPPVAPPAATPPPEPALPAMVTVEISTDPPGAKLTEGGSVLGMSPAQLIVPRGKGALNVTVELAGFKPVTQGVNLSTAGKDPVKLAIKLEAEAPKAEQPKAEQPKVEQPKPRKQHEEVKTFE